MRKLKLPFKKISLAAFALLLAGSISFSDNPVHAEGSAQFNTAQYLYDTTTVYADVLNAGETINISLCRDATINIWDTSGTPADQSDDIQVVTGDSFTANITCSDPMDSPLGGAYQYTPTSTGTYKMTFDVPTHGQFPDFDWIERFDFSVTPNSATQPDPTLTKGRIWSYQWGAIARVTGDSCSRFCESVSTSLDMFVLVPGPMQGENFVWKLDLNKFAGGGYTLTANSLGLDAPYSGVSAADSASSVTPEFPIYLGYPDKTGPTGNTTPPTISTVGFEDDDGYDTSTITPSSSSGVRDTGSFSFDTNVNNATYAITIDINDDDQYGAGDVLLLGKADKDTVNSIQWDGKKADGTTVDSGTYDVQVEIRTGEYHFIANDVETSGGPSDRGLTIYRATDENTTQNTTVYWNDKTFLGGISNLPNGVTSGSMADSNNDGQADGFHTWGNFMSGGYGDKKNIDTYVYGPSVVATTSLTIADSSADTDGDGVPEQQEITAGTDPDDSADYTDTDSDVVPDYVETSAGTNPNDASDYTESDSDVVPDYIETRDDTNSDDPAEYKDSDGDLVPDYIEETYQVTDGGSATDSSDKQDAVDTDNGSVPDYVETVLLPNLGQPATDPTDKTDDIADDNDGSASAIERAAPGSGDANNDGVIDEDQASVTSTVNPVTGKYAVLEADGCTAGNSAVAVVPESAGTQADGSYKYPVGLMNFTIDCLNPGDTATVAMYFYGFSATDFVFRKYNPYTGSYTTIDAATSQQVTIGDKRAAKIVYQITDGGALDLDGQANGTITDPAGPAVLTNPVAATGTDNAVAAPNTGLPTTNMALFGVAILAGVGLLLSRVAPIRRLVHSLTQESTSTNVQSVGSAEKEEER